MPTPTAARGKGLTARLREILADGQPHTNVELAAAIGRPTLHTQCLCRALERNGEVRKIKEEIGGRISWQRVSSMATEPTTPAKPLISDFEKREIIDTLSNPRISPRRLAWAHYLIGRAMMKNNIDPYAIEHGRAVRRATSQPL